MMGDLKRHTCASCEHGHENHFTNGCHVPSCPCAAFVARIVDLSPYEVSSENFKFNIKADVSDYKPATDGWGDTVLLSTIRAWPLNIHALAKSGLVET